MSTVGIPKRANSKGMAILAAFREAGPEGATRAAVAVKVGCTVARVGEVIRASAPQIRKAGKVYVHEDFVVTGADEQVTTDEVQEAVADAVVEGPGGIADGVTRTGRCEHEKAAKKGKGTCTVCPPLA